MRRRVQRSPPAQIERRHAGADGATPERGESLGAVGLGGEVQPALELRPEAEEPRAARALLDTLRLLLRLRRLRLPRRTQQRGTTERSHAHARFSSSFEVFAYKKREQKHAQQILTDNSSIFFGSAT